MMENHEKILTHLKKKIYKPIYFLSGEEPYYIDLISSFIEKNVLSEEEKYFNQTILYGGETDMETVIAQLRRYPIRSRYTVVLLKEAQLLEKSIEKILDYLKSPFNSTILVVCYKHKVCDKKICNIIKEIGVFLDSKKFPENKIPSWIESQVRNMGRIISVSAQNLLAEYLGISLSTIACGLKKLDLALPTGSEITLEDIEIHIGLHKRFNLVEWQKAIFEKDVYKIQTISWLFVKNKEYSILLLIHMLYRFFTNMVKYHTSIPETENNLKNFLNVPLYLIKYYEKSAYHYSLSKSLQVFSFLREADKQLKGIDCPATTDYSILKELLYKILK